MQRLQKILASCGIGSRRECETLIINGRIKVNGDIITRLGHRVSPKDEITFDDVPVMQPMRKYYVMFKPSGYICSNNDEYNRPIIFDLLPDNLQDMHLFTIGRLDYDTRGVILITNDGEFKNQLAGPSSGIEKEYLVRVQGIVDYSEINRLENGVYIKGTKTLPAIASIVSLDRKNNSSLIRLTITQGMYHQVKEMFLAIGHPVKKLTRVRFGCIKTDDLREGEIRELKPHEVTTLFTLAKQDKNLRHRR